MKKFIILMTVLVMLAGILAGCGAAAQKADSAAGTAAAVQSTASSDKSTAEAKSSVFPLTVKDAGGMEITLEKQPAAIVSLTLGTDEMLLSLVDKSRIKALTRFSDDPNISNVVDKAKDIPGRAVSEAEKVIALSPDLVFVDTWAQAEFVKQLRDAKIAVYQFKTPSSIDEQKKTVLEVAHVVGEDSRGQEVVSWMDGKLKEVEDRLKNLKPEEKLTGMEYSEMGTSSGKGTNFDDIATHAGLVNVTSKAGLEGWPQMSKEKMIELNPDVLVIPSWYYDKNNTLDSFKAKLTGDKSLAGIKAVKENRMIAPPAQHVSAISQYVVLGVEDIAKAVYPDLFK